MCDVSRSIAFLFDHTEQGNTKVAVSVFGPHECRRRAQAAHDRAVINVQYSVAHFSRSERRKFNKNDRCVRVPVLIVPFRVIECLRDSFLIRSVAVMVVIVVAAAAAAQASQGLFAAAAADV